jgi:hypothetical protein
VGLSGTVRAFFFENVPKAEPNSTPGTAKDSAMRSTRSPPRQFLGERRRRGYTLRSSSIE